MIMKKKINIAELLKDCPNGMELDCKMFDTKVFYQGLETKIPTHPIVVQTEHGFEFELTQYGQIHNIVGSKCVIFPKGKTTWDGFQKPFKSGEILSNGICVCIYNGNESDKYYGCYVCVGHIDFPNYFINCSQNSYFTKENSRLATEEEKQKLFDVIKANGYKWNKETKTLEKLIKPKFKVGDYVAKKNGISVPVLITKVGDEFYYSNTEKSIGVFSVQEQDDWVLVPNKFDITTLKPFDKVLVRDTDDQMWTVDMFSFYNEKNIYPFACVGHYINQCIPYEENKHLLGTTNDCDNYYKTW